MSNDQFQTFLSFNDPELATFICEKLQANNIEYIYNDTKPVLDKAFVDTSLHQNIHIKIRHQDFPKAHQILNEFYSTQVDNVDRDYYLFSFSNKELKEIIAKPDEWGHFDFQLAIKILNDRKEGFDEEKVAGLNEQRIMALTMPQKASDFMIFIGYFSSLFGLISGFFGYIFFFLSFGGLLIGKNLLHDRKTLPNGEEVYSYIESDRRHGKRIIIAGSLSIIAALVTLIWWVVS